MAKSNGKTKKVSYLVQEVVNEHDLFIYIVDAGVFSEITNQGKITDIIIDDSSLGVLPNVLTYSHFVVMGNEKLFEVVYLRCIDQ